LRYRYAFWQFTFVFFHVFSIFMPFLYHILYGSMLVSFHCQLLYVNSLDVSSLDDLVLPEAEFTINRWSRENIDKVLLFDLIDKHIYGKIEVIICMYAWITLLIY
jgi:hypothetical protein